MGDDMSRSRRSIDVQFLVATLLLAVSGFIIFTSASLGLLVQKHVSYGDVIWDQLFLGFIGGFIALGITAHIHYRFWRKYAFWFFLASVLVSLLVFIPALNIEYGGAARWVDLGFASFQPSEALKIGFVIYFAAWISGTQKKIHTLTYGLVPFLVLLTITGAILLLQPDTDTFAVIAAAGLGMFFVSGARWHHILIVILIGGITIASLAIARPYVMERFQTYLDPTQDPLSQSYQIRQSFIAIGSGQWFGRGFGESIQKFNYLPEPIGDSIFAVAAEEFGFVGSLVILTLYGFFIYRGLLIAARAPDTFARQFVVGVMMIIAVQSLLNMGSMVGLVPLSGIPLVFISKGGTSLAMTLAVAGIILNISRYRRPAKRPVRS